MEVATSGPVRGHAGQSGPAGIVRLLFGVLVSAALLLGGSGRWTWPGAWAYLALTTGGALAALLTIGLCHPGLAEERVGRWREGKAWDKPLVFILAIAGPWGVQLVCALDQRFGWSPPVAPWLQISAVVGIVLGVLLTLWALSVNPFFSALVRIQTDRGHRVVASGPYRFIRHPGYAGAVVTTLLSPVLLESLWGFVPALVVTIAIVVRTAWEDATLHAELDNYVAYASSTRYRLLPLVW